MPATVHSDLCTPETTEFIVLLPDDVLHDEPRREGLIDRLEISFPGSTFRAVQCESLHDPEGKRLIVTEPLVVPMMGTAGDGSQPEPMRRRPSPSRMSDITATMLAYLGGPASLH